MSFRYQDSVVLSAPSGTIAEIFTDNLNNINSTELASVTALFEFYRVCVMKVQFIPTNTAISDSVFQSTQVFS
jgi:hypothetical protein